jgi:hypothetical protein
VDQLSATGYTTWWGKTGEGFLVLAVFGDDNTLVEIARGDDWETMLLEVAHRLKPLQPALG